MDYIKEFYNNYDEDGRLTDKKHLPEFLITMNYILRYLSPNAKILETGAGAGRYSIALAEKGYDITAVEFVPHNIEIMKTKVKCNHRITIYEGNACNLDFLKNESFDIVLLLGPMYHLFNDEDKHSAISEALRVVKKKGIVFSAYCNSDTTVLNAFEKRNFIEYYEKGMIDKSFHTVSKPSDVFELYRKEDIDRLMQSFNVKRLHYVSTDLVTYMISSINDFTDKEFSMYMTYLLSICERPDMAGLSFHMLDIFRKN